MRYIPLAIFALIVVLGFLGWISFLRNGRLLGALESATSTLDAIEAKADEFSEIDSVLAGAVKNLIRKHRNR